MLDLACVCSIADLENASPHPRRMQGTPDAGDVVEKVLVLVDGTWPDEAQLRAITKPYLRVFAADGAGHRALGMGLDLDGIIGDLDSFEPDSLAGVDVPIRRIDDQSMNDLVKAVRYASRSARTAHVDVIGVRGGSWGHEVGNLGALVELADLRVRFIDPPACLQLVGADLELNPPIGSLLTLMPFGVVHDVQLTGTEWTLDGETLTPSTRGLHNVTKDASVRITHGAGGHLMVITEEIH